MTTPTDAETVCRFGMPLPHPAPVLPCWYCNGKDGDGQTYDPQVHHGWACEACDERRALRTSLTRAEEAIQNIRDHEMTQDTEDFIDTYDAQVAPAALPAQPKEGEVR